jgi:hypothetical protein
MAKALLYQGKVMKSLADMKHSLHEGVNKHNFDK